MCNGLFNEVCRVDGGSRGKRVGKEGWSEASRNANEKKG